MQAIAAAKLRLEQRQQDADIARGRNHDDGRKPQGKDGKPTGGRPFKRDFGVPKDNARESFTDTDSRIMKRAGGGYDYAYNAHTAVDEKAQIVVAAELNKNAADSDRLPMLLQAVKANLGKDADQVLADARFRSEAVFEQLKDCPSELIVALGREGKQAVAIDAQKYPRTAAMDARLKTPQGQAAYSKRKWIVEAPNGWIKSVLGFRQLSLRGLKKAQAEFKLVCLALNLRRAQLIDSVRSEGARMMLPAPRVARKT